MTVTIDLPDVVYVNTEALTKVTFRTPARARPVDPSTVTLTIQDGNGDITVLTYGVADNVVRNKQGEYSATVLLNVPGSWTLKWTGTGACNVPNLVTFQVTPLPF
jgi:hypothetical protein